jgi:heme a synthase
MNRTFLNRLSLTLTAGLFLLLAQGAVDVSRGTESKIHLPLGMAVGASALVWAAAMKRVRPEGFLLAVTVLVAVTVSGWTGVMPSPAGKVTHAVASHLAFALAAAGAAMTSTSWEARLAVADGGFPTLRSLAWMTPATVLVQVALGAAYRHKMTGLIPHVSWAFVAAMFVIMTAAFTMTQCGKHPALRRISIAVISITGIQLVLGVTALLGRVMETPAGTGWMVVSTASHVLTGAIVLALSMALSAQTLRHVEPAGETGLAASGHNG